MLEFVKFGSVSKTAMSLGLLAMIGVIAFNLYVLDNTSKNYDYYIEHYNPATLKELGYNDTQISQIMQNAYTLHFKTVHNIVGNPYLQYLYIGGGFVFLCGLFSFIIEEREKSTYNRLKTEKLKLEIEKLRKGLGK